MPDSKVGTLESAINEIRKCAQGKRFSIDRAEEYCRSIARRDYDRALKRHFERTELRDILKEVQRSLPTLNREIYRVTDLEDLGKIAKDLGAVLRPRPFPRSDGAGFRGFYVGQAELLKRPSIWVNSAPRPATVAAAFWHEVGHHLTNEILKVGPNCVSLSYGLNFRDHLADRKEIAADMVRVLGGYPRPVAVRLFGGKDLDAIRYDADQLVAKAISHVRKVMAFDFQNQFSPKENLFYLGGMIHTAKLRITLLSEYGI